MNHDSIRLRVTVESMREELLHHFADYENVIRQSIEKAVTPENIALEIQRQVESTLALKISLELIAMVSRAVANSKNLKGLIDVAVERYFENVRSSKKAK